MKITSEEPGNEEIEKRIKESNLSEFACKPTRETVKENEERYRLLLEAIPDPVVVYGSNHVISYINEAFAETYGWAKNDLIGGMIDFVPPEEIENTKEAWRRTLLGEKVFFETKRKTKDGRVLNIQLRTSILKDRVGNHTASIVIHRDVTLLKQTEMERERLIGELQKALSEVKKLSGLLPICSHCKKVRDDKGYWNQIESYIGDHSEAKFSHSICQECAKKYFPEMDIYDDKDEAQQ
ncbi:MAG: PAS domain S-box protein [Pseudomonadota bacterium]